jgi:hypothetical protein
MTTISSNININKKQSSTKSKKYKCVFCSNTFSQSSGLSHHKKVCKGIVDACLLKEQLEKVKETSDKEKLELITENDQSKQKVLELANKLQVASRLLSGCGQVALINDINNSNQISKHVCNFCNNTFKTSSNLSNHIKICGKKTELEKRIEELTKENESLLEEKQTWLEDKKLLHKDKDAFANLATVNGNIANTSLSTLKYLMTYHKDTPVLKSLEDFTSISDKYEDDTELVYALISEYRNDTLAAKLSDHLVLEYKKKDPSKQSLWSCDVGRLTYVIRNAVSDSRVVWSTDKNGILVTEIVIKPILNYVKPILRKFNSDCSNEIINNPKLSNSKMTEISEYQKLTIQIIMLIENKTLERDIIRHMAPHFYWNKNYVVKQQPTIEFEEDKQEIKQKKIKTSKPPKKDKIFVKPKKTVKNK